MFSVFIDSIIDETGLSRTALSALYAIGTGISAVTVIFISRMADRYGPRRTLGLVGLSLGLACFGMALSYHIIGLLFALVVLRAMGQGSLPIHSTLLIAQWFVRLRGLAVAIAGLGFAVGIALIPIMSRTLIEAIGWRETYMILGVMVWALVIPAALFLVRNTPEEVGLHPDGASHPPENEPPHLAGVGAADRRKVLTSLTFWLLALTLATPAFVLTALIFHQVSIFADRGLSATTAATVFVPYAFAAAGASMAGGYLIQRLGPRGLGTLTLIGLIGVLVLVQYIDSPAKAIGYAVLLGVVGGSSQIIIGVAWAHYYGRHGLGKVQGSAMMVLISGAAIGPLFLAAIRSAFDEYSVGIWVMTALPILGIGALQLATHQLPGRINSSAR